MNKENTPWWKDPKFIIPAILIPVGLALIERFPSFLSESVSNELAVTMTMTDPRRSESGSIETTVAHHFVTDGKSESQTANEIARSIVADILADRPDLNKDRKKIALTIAHAADGTVFIEKPDDKGLAIHLGRFADYKNLAGLMAALEADGSANRMIQMPLSESVLPTDALAISVVDRKIQAGVYRIVVSAPGYMNHSIYLQLSDDGKPTTLSDSNTVIELNFPISLDLLPRASHPLRIAIRPCHTSMSTSSKPAFTAIDKAIREEMMTEFRKNNFTPILVDEEQAVGFDLNISKNLPPTEGLVSADFLIENCRSEWLE